MVKGNYGEAPASKKVPFLALSIEYFFIFLNVRDFDGFSHRKICQTRRSMLGRLETAGDTKAEKTAGEDGVRADV